MTRAGFEVPNKRSVSLETENTRGSRSYLEMALEKTTAREAGRTAVRHCTSFMVLWVPLPTPAGRERLQRRVVGDDDAQLLTLLRGLAVVRRLRVRVVALALGSALGVRRVREILIDIWQQIKLQEGRRVVRQRARRDEWRVADDELWRRWARGRRRKVRGGGAGRIGRRWGDWRCREGHGQNGTGMGRIPTGERI